MELRRKDNYTNYTVAVPGPGNWTGYFSVHAQILNYLEQVPAYNALNFATTNTDKMYSSGTTVYSPNFTGKCLLWLRARSSVRPTPTRRGRCQRKQLSL